MTPWSRICISHADCVLLVGAEEANPQVPSPDTMHFKAQLVQTCAGKAGLLPLLSSSAQCLLNLRMEQCICG